MGSVRSSIVASSLMLMTATFASRAWAGKNDLQLLNLCPVKSSSLPNRVPECSWVHRLADGSIDPNNPVLPDGQGREDFRSLMSELGVVLAPRIPMVADTVGFGGFQLSGELGVTGISNNRRFWNGVEGVSATNTNATRPDAMLTTVGFFVRKGIWLPVPTIELGFGAVHLLDSQLLAWQSYAKFGIHEGFHDWPIPSFAVRGAVSYLTGTDQATMTVTSLDLLVSKRFGLLKTARLEPFAGWSLISIFAHSGILDATPSCDATKIAAIPAGGDPGNPYCSSSQTGTPNDLNANFRFPDQNAITRYRLFVGFKIKFAIAFFAAQYEAYFSGSTRDGSAFSAKDQSGTQNALSLSTGLDF
jgi:hypothetical protein